MQPAHPETVRVPSPTVDLAHCTPGHGSHKTALKLLEKQLPKIKAALVTFTKEIYDVDTPKDVAVD